jgi:hypothetical protein
MQAVKKVLRKAIVNEFYKANAGFFLVVLGLGFGFLKLPQHVEIVSLLAMKPLFYLVPLVVCLLYITKVLAFIIRIKKLPQNYWLTYLDLLSQFERRLTIIHIQALLLAPILVYGGFMASVAYQLEQWFSVVLVIIGSLILLLLSALIVNKKIVFPIDGKAQSSLKKISQWLPRVFPLFFIHQLLGRQAILLLGTKIASIAIVIGAIFIFQMEGVDLRIISLGLLLTGAVNTVLCFHYHEFEQNQLVLFRNLPLVKSKQFLWFSSTYLILLIPELAILFGNLGFEISLLFLIQVAMLPASILVFFHYLFHLIPMNMEGFTKYVFFVSVILFFVILGHANPAIIIIAFLAISYLILLTQGQVSKPLKY